MEEIKVGEYGLEERTEGMYARTTSGIIGMIINCNSDEMINGPEIQSNDKIFCVERDSIKKVEDRIVDLIEEGDIAVMDCFLNVKKFITRDDIIELKLGNFELLEILTKEQFNQMKYIVGDESNVKD